MANFAIYKDSAVSIVTPIGPQPSNQSVSIVGANDQPLEVTITNPNNAINTVINNIIA